MIAGDHLDVIRRKHLILPPGSLAAKEAKTKAPKQELGCPYPDDHPAVAAAESLTSKNPEAPIDHKTAQLHEAKPLDRDTGETAKVETLVDSKPDDSSNVKMNAVYSETKGSESEKQQQPQQNKGIVNRLKSMFKF